MKSGLFLIAIAAILLGCEMKGADTAVTTTGKLPIPAVNQKEIRLSWARASGAVEGYKVEISFDGASFVELGYIMGQTDGVVLPPFDAGVKYYFRARAFNLAGNGPYSPVSMISF